MPDPLGGLVLFALVAIAPTVLVWFVLRGHDWLRALRRRLRPPAPVAAGPPVERLAADLRRLRRSLRQLPPGVSMVRRRGIQLAYDDVLVQACRALAVEHRLAELPDGLERDVERLRMEESLTAEGLVIS